MMLQLIPMTSEYDEMGEGVFLVKVLELRFDSSTPHYFTLAVFSCVTPFSLLVPS